MGKPIGTVRATKRVAETSGPPAELTSTQSIARVIKAAGNSLYSCTLPSGKEILVELPSRFRNTCWLKNGGYILVDTRDAEARKNKIGGEIQDVVMDEREWRKEAYWPKEFPKVSWYPVDSDEEDSVVGKMPPLDDSDIED